MKNLLTIIGILSVGITFGQSKKAQDIAAIKNMCGCYEVKFNFAETFSYSKDENYKPSEVHHSGGLEWVELLEDDNDKLVLQHLLIVGKSDAPHIVKHWRQDWEYQNPDLLMFYADGEWRPVSMAKNETKGQWTQRVFQVDDSPRYEGSSSWVHADGRSYWENTTDAPLPRREFSKRSDYNVTVRTNRHEITSSGWIHEQDNDKVIRDGEEDVLLAQEKGMNTYTKVPDERCKAAQDWWTQNKTYWSDVRTVWSEFYSSKKTLVFNPKVEDKRLFDRLFELGDQVREQATYDSETTKAEVRSIIKAFLKNSSSLTSR